MKGERKIAGYVKRHQKHAALAARYQAKIDALLPLKRKVDAALVALKIQQQKMTGGELAKAQHHLLGLAKSEARKIGRPDPQVVEAMQGFDNRHED